LTQWFKHIQVLMRIERDMICSPFVNESDFFWIPATTLWFQIFKHEWWMFKNWSDKMVFWIFSQHVSWYFLMWTKSRILNSYYMLRTCIFSCWCIIKERNLFDYGIYYIKYITCYWSKENKVTSILDVFFRSSWNQISSSWDENTWNEINLF
jgi:hypothetical protein